jgi:formiminotetrahydrofolate cyclodeaminase/glutamate formiminotransferase/formiminotetrahydrofolate cyclodeaminase
MMAPYAAQISRYKENSWMDQYNAFYRVLDPQDNATGGGAASAVGGAMAAALVGMVARVSIGRKKMPESDRYYEDINRQAQELVAALLAGSNADSSAFDAVMAAYRLPRGSAEEKAERSAAIQAAMAGATRTPLANAAGCARALEMAAALQGRSNPNAGSDLDCAVYLAEAGFYGAISNAEINIADLKDKALAAEFQAQVFELKDRVVSLKGQA